jgi:hypothetical protein
VKNTDQFFQILVDQTSIIADKKVDLALVFQNEPNFKTLEKISEKEKSEIIKTRFQLSQEVKISLKNYSEETGRV